MKTTLSIVMTHAQEVRKIWGVSLSVALKFAWQYHRTIFTSSWSEDCVLIEAVKTSTGEKTFRKAPKRSLAKQNGCLCFFSPYNSGYRSFKLENVVSITSVRDEFVERVVREKAGAENEGKQLAWIQAMEKIGVVKVSVAA